MAGITITGQGKNTEINGSGLSPVFYLKNTVNGAASGIHFSDFSVINANQVFSITPSSPGLSLFDFSFENLDLEGIASPTTTTKGFTITGYPSDTLPSTTEISDIRIRNCNLI